jgi:hypothetical protein
MTSAVELRMLVIAAQTMIVFSLVQIDAGVTEAEAKSIAVLVAGSVAEMFGLRWQAMIQGVAFFSHQMGSFLGAFGGGLLYTWLGNYEMAWRAGVTLGLVAGLVQIAVAVGRPPATGRGRFRARPRGCDTEPERWPARRSGTARCRAAHEVPR